MNSESSVVFLRRRNGTSLQLRLPHSSAERFRAMSECTGVPINVSLKWALIDSVLKAEVETGITASRAVEMTTAERKQFGRAYRKRIGKIIRAAGVASDRN